MDINFQIMVGEDKYNPFTLQENVLDSDGISQSSKNSNFKQQIEKNRLNIVTNTKAIEELSKTVSTNTTSISEINKLNSEQQKTIDDLLSKVSSIKPTNVAYLDDYGDLEDYSPVINQLVTDGINVIICSPKEYQFKSTMTISKRLNIIGNYATFKWLGSGRMFEFINAPWLIEGSSMENLFVWGRGQNVGNDIFVYGETPHVMMTFRNLTIYNFYCCFRFHTQCFGHRIEDCSMWGFTIAINATGNAEQISVIHCWFDDGYRTGSSQNPVIRVEDATSFWIERCVIQNADIGISFRGVRNGIIRGNHFENMIRQSIWFYPASMYENRNCVVDCNYLVGGNSAIHFIVGTQKNVHNTITNNYIAYLGDSAKAAITGSQTNACEYTLYYNNSLAPEHTSKPLMTEGVSTNKITSFQ